MSQELSGEAPTKAPHAVQVHHAGLAGLRPQAGSRGRGQGILGGSHHVGGKDSGGQRAGARAACWQRPPRTG